MEQVHITDIPDWEVYEHRRDALYPNGWPDTPLPAGFPCELSQASVWSNQSLNPRDLVIMITQDDRLEIENALAGLKKTRLTVTEIDQSNFVLPTLGPRLLDAAKEVAFGKGIVILRNLGMNEQCLQDKIIIFAGIGSYFGNKRGIQGREKDFLVHLRDAGSKIVPDHLRPSPFANQYQAFHTDFCDVIGMYVLQTAATGGQSYWASSGQVYNELVATRPHLIQTMADPHWPFQSSFKSSPILKPRPILFPSAGQPVFCFSRTNLTGTDIVPRDPGTANLNVHQADALDALHFAAEKHAITVQHQPGDMYFLNNLRVLHGRAAFTDDRRSASPSTNSDDGSETSSASEKDKLTRHERHIMRLWLRNTEMRSDESIPESLKPRWEEVFGEASIRQGKWAFDKVHTKSLIMASLNDELQSFS